MGEEDVVGVLDVLIGHEAMVWPLSGGWVVGSFVGLIGHWAAPVGWVSLLLMALHRGCVRARPGTPGRTGGPAGRALSARWGRTDSSGADQGAGQFGA